ncbi:MAG: GNAT family N-acetyltransferase [Yoonia sp.]|uniref:GNAT family N-acetyltransferase n=1 Tax=Yoonia sp. TaxID=2212373 RepID=UPI00273E31B0|nr:GNAT family N-acetyltransferase [Yoonia sp.]MDP5084834.1 GNAT family N-acetyltransferase [Yoonia sp.]
MMLKEGEYAVPKGHLAAVVTHLEMTAPAMTAPKPFPQDVTATCETPDIASYRALFRAVGDPWLWTSRHLVPDDALSAILTDRAVEIWIIRQGDAMIGFVELDFRTAGECALAYFGLIPAATGQGLGGPMMALAQRQAFSREISRFHVHTCSLDAPGALAFYQRTGFVPYKAEVDIFPDPRLRGVIHPTQAKHVPCLP